MAVSKYSTSDGREVWMATIKLRSKTDRNVMVQKKKKGLKSEKEALRVFKDLRDQAVLELQNREAQGKSWLDLLEAWQNYLQKGDGITKPLAVYTAEDYAGTLRKYTGEWFKKPVCQISRSDVRKVLDEAGEKVSPIRAQKIRGWLHKAFTWAIDAEFDPTVRENPVLGIKITRVKREKRPDILTGNEIRKLLETAKALRSPWYPVWAMAVMTGMRSGELYALKWDDVSFDQSVIWVTKSYSKRAHVKEADKYPDGIKGTKSERWRMVDMNEDLKSFLKDLRRTSGKSSFVLPRINAWRNNDQAGYLKKFCSMIGIQPVVFHALRACFAVQMLQNGVPPVQVMAIAGWEDMKTMMRYVRMAGVDIKGATKDLSLLPPEEAMGKVVPLFKS